jgi:putative DNA primase/helicase
VARAAFSVAPLHAITGHTIGSGKSFLVDLFAAVSMGRQCPVVFVGDDIQEFDKKLNGLLLSGVTMVSIDNIRCELDSDILCQACERPVLSLRKLSGSDMYQVLNSVCLFGTGNNLVVRDEMVRRALLAAIDATHERPELRTFKGNPIATVLADRGRYIAAALTIIRAHIAAGRPSKQSPLGSYGAWSVFVRDPLMWLGKADPVLSQDTVRKIDPVSEELAEVMQGWQIVIGLDVPMTVSAIKKLLTDGMERTLGEPQSDWERRHQAFPEFRDALFRVAKERSGQFAPEKFGRWLRHRKGRVLAGRRFMADDGKTDGANRWRLIGV